MLSFASISSNIRTEGFAVAAVASLGDVLVLRMQGGLWNTPYVAASE
jgi:hypothetical protein